MKKLLFLLLSLIGFTYSIKAAPLSSDTLFTAEKASEIMVERNLKQIKVTVKGAFPSGENYFYSTGAENAGKIRESSISFVKDPENIDITEIDGRQLRVVYRTPGGEMIEMTLDIPDAGNRFVKEYFGSRSDYFGVPLGRRGKSKWSLVSTGLGMGWATPLNSSPSFPTSMGRSMEWTWLSVLGVDWSCGVHSLTSGVGIYWRNYALDSNRYFQSSEGGSLEILPYGTEIDKGKSRLQTFSLQLPFMYGLKFGRNKNFSVTLGPVVNFNTGANIKTQYKIGRQDISETTHGIKRTPVTVDAFAAIGWSALSLYARYSPMKVLKSSTNLEFSSFSTGVMFLF